MRKLFLPALLLMTLVPALIPVDVHADEKAAMQRMAQEHQHDKPTPSPAAMQEPARPVTAEEVTYGEAGGKTLHGYVARPRTAQGALPSLIVIHEWWGLNDNIRAMTRRLAGEGYQALAVDLYGGAHADTPDAAMKLMNAAMQNPAAAQDNLKLAAAWLQGKGAKKLGVIGWCFGGGWSLDTTLLMPGKIDGTVIYYGHLETDPAKLASLKHPVLGLLRRRGPEHPGRLRPRLRERPQEAGDAGRDQDLRRRRPCLRQPLGRQLPAGRRQGRLAADDGLPRPHPQEIAHIKKAGGESLAARLGTSNENPVLPSYILAALVTTTRVASQLAPFLV